MAKAHPIWRGFNAGEWSDLMAGAVDHKQYPFSVAYMRNFKALLQGPAQTRAGFRFIAAAKYDDKAACLAEFVYNKVQSYMLEWGDEYVRFFADKGQIPISGTTTPYEVVTPYDSTHVFGLQFARSNDVSYISHPSYFPNKLTRLAHDSWTIADAPFVDGPYLKENIDNTLLLKPSATSGTGVTLGAIRSVRADIGTWGGVAAADVPLFTAADPCGGFSFTTTADCRLSTVFLYLTAAPAGDVITTAYIYSDVAGSPGALLATSLNTENLKNDAGSNQQYDFDPLDLTASTTYWVVWDSDVTDAAIKVASVVDVAGHGSGVDVAIATITDSMATEFKCAITLTTDTAASLFNADHVGSLWRLRHTGLTSTKEHGSVSENIGIPVTMYGAFVVDFTPTLPSGSGDYFQGFVTLQKSTNLLDWTDVAIFSQSTRQDFFENKPGIWYRTYSKPADIQAGFAWARIIQNQQWGVVRVTAYTSVSSVTVEVLSTLASTDRTPYWREGAWSTYRGYPTAMGWYQDRLCFGGSAYRPKTVWMSWTGDYETFMPDGPGDDAAIDITLQDLQNPIQWIAAMGNSLVIGSNGEEATVFARATKAFSATNLDTSVPEHIGSAVNAAPVRAGPALIFIQTQRKAIHELVYSMESDGLSSPDLTSLASHMGGTTGFKQLAYQQSPDRIIWGDRNDGLLSGLTYYRKEDVLGWQVMETAGLIESVACKPSGFADVAGRDEPWVLVNRTIGGQTKRHVELLEDNGAAIDARSVKDCFTVDSGLSYSGAATDTITGLDHLEGEDVYGLANGMVVGPLTVTGGQVTLPDAATPVHLGLPYTCTLKTMRVEAGAMDGTAQGRTKQFSRMVFRFLCTIGGKFGPALNQLQEFSHWITGTQVLGSPAVPFDGDLTEMWPGGSDTDGQVVIVQDQPLPMTVVAIMPEVDTE